LSIQNVGQPLKRRRRIQATLLTSRNALAACQPDYRCLPTFAVGDATAVLAERSGFGPVMTASGDAIALANLVAKTIMPSGGSLYLPTGHGQGFELAASLRLKGFKVVRHVVYEARPVLALPANADIQLRQNGVDVVMFFSAETARHFVRLITASGLKDVMNTVGAVSISERAAAPLRQLAWRSIRIADKPNQDSMLVLLQ
jgi:uroporphyrinogen-III synthase